METTCVAGVGRVRAEGNGVLRGACWLAGLVVAATLWGALCTVPAVPWNPPRLAPSFAFAYGKSFYALPSSAEQLGWIYGPLFPLWNLPATLTSNPTVALLVMGVLNAVAVIAPLILVARVAGVARPRIVHAATLLLVLLVMASSMWRWQFIFVHVDVLCVALGLAACAALHRAVERGGAAPLHLAALSLVLAVATKQIAVFLLPALCLWLWREGQARLIGKLIFWCVVHGGIVGTAILQWFGAEEVIFNLVVYHTLLPAQRGVGGLIDLLALCTGSLWPWLPLVACVWAVARKRALPPRAAAMVRLLLWAAVVQLPIGLVATHRPGASVNSLHSGQFALAAGLIYLSHALAVGWPASRSRAWVWSVAVVLPATMAIVHAVHGGARWTIHRGHEELLATVRASPGRYYVPWNPLVTLIAERRIYPFDDALFCLQLVGRRVPEAAVRATVPQRPIFIYEEPVQGKYALSYFPEIKTGK